MIINQQPPSSGGGGGAGEWTDIRSAISGDMPFPVAVCETDGTYVHVMGSIPSLNQEIYIEGYPPKEDISANMYKAKPSGDLSVSGMMCVEAAEYFDTPSAYVSAINGADLYTAFSVVYPIAT